MKKNLIAFIFILASFTAFSQQSVLCKIKFLPNHTYKSSTSWEKSVSVNAVGITPEDSAEMKIQGMQIPLSIVDQQQVSMTIQPGSELPNKKLSTILNYDKFIYRQTVNGKIQFERLMPLTGKKIYGNTDSEGNFDIDSINGKDGKELMKSNLIKGLINQAVYEVKFPKHSLKISEKFVQRKLMSFSFCGVNASYDLKTVYQLVKLDDDKAYFDLVESFNFNSDGPGTGIIKVEGAGTGTLIYGIKESYPLNFQSNVQIICITKLPSSKSIFKISQKDSINQQTIVTSKD